MKNKAKFSIIYENGCFDIDELQVIEKDLDTYDIELTAKERGWRINASLDFFVPIIEFVFSPEFPIEVCSSLAVSGVVGIMTWIYKKFHHRSTKIIQADKITDISPNIHFRIGSDALVLPIDVEYSKYAFAVDKFMETALKFRSDENTYVFLEENGERLIAKTERQIIDEECRKQKVLEKINTSVEKFETDNGMEEGKNKVNEHALKEMLKRIVDESPNYSERMKFDLKNIIDWGSSPEEILKACMFYFSMSRWT